MQYFRNLFVFVFLIFSLQLSAQQKPMEAKELLEESMRFFQENPNFEIDLQYTLFRNIDNPVVIEQYQGKLIKKGKNRYLKIHNTEFIVTNDEFLKINHKEKAMEYINTSFSNLPQNPLDVNQYLNYFEDKKVTNTNNLISCELTTPKLTQLPYYSITLFFDKDSFMLKKQIMALVAPARIRDENGKLTASSKFLEIKIKNIDTSIPDKGYFNIEKYIQEEDNSVMTATKYASYKLIDRRVK